MVCAVAWDKVKKDIDANRDPVYDSEDEADWSATELRPRVLGFAFTNHSTGQRDTLQYEGPAPDFDPELLANHAVNLANRLATSSPSLAGMSTENGVDHLDQSEFMQVYSENNINNCSADHADDDDGEDDELDDESGDGDISVGLNSSGRDADFSRLLQDV